MAEPHSQYEADIESDSKAQEDYDDESGLSLDQLEMSSIAVIDPEWRQSNVGGNDEEVKMFDDTQ